jgi:succinoglycan biosynthesis transport protein ExoP
LDPIMTTGQEPAGAWVRPVGRGQQARPADLLDALRWRWKIALGVAVCVVVGGVAFAETQPAEYDGVAVVSFTPRPGIGSDVIRVVVAKYETYVSSRSLAAKLAPAVDEDVDTLDLAVDTSTSQETGNLGIRVRLRDPEKASAAANIYADAVLDRAGDDQLVLADLASPSLPAKTPAAPPRRLIEVAALMAGLVAACALVFILGRARPLFRSWQELEAVTGYRVLGRLPSSKTLGSTPKLAFSDARLWPAVRSLQGNLEPHIREGNALVAVTSPARKSGGTSVAVVLSESLARAGLETLLVDADVRDPAIAGIAAVAARPGLLAALGGDGLQTSIRRGWVPGLWVLPTAREKRGAETLAGGFPNLATDVRSRVDAVVVDTAPVLTAREAQAVLQPGTAALLVVTRRATQRDVVEAIRAVESLDVPLLGLVANRFSTTGVPD